MVIEATQIPIIEIGVIVIASMVFGIVANRFRLPSSIGYILAGILLGPLFFKFLAPGQGIAQVFGDIGLLLLLFYLGLELSIKKFRESGALAVVLSLVEMGLPFILGFIVALLFGFGFLEAMIIGAMLTATSTVMVARFILERGIEKETESRIALSILVVEDFFAILVLAFLFSLSSAGSFKQTLLNGILFVIAMLFVVSRITRFASKFFEKQGRTSVMTLFALGIGIIVAYFGAYLGLTIALGAYFAGFALTETPFGERVKKEIGFMREFFILFFFVSFGTTVTFPSAGSLLLLAALLIAFVAARMFGYLFFGTAFGLTADSAAKLSTLMIPIGEFSLLIAAAASQFFKNPGELVSLAFMLMLCSTLISPVLYDRWRQISKFIQGVYPSRLRKATGVLSKELHSLERAYQNTALQNEFSSSLKSFIVNCVVALAIVYMALLASFNIDLSFIPFIPKELSLNAIILPFVIWPIYKATNDLKFLAYSAISSWSKAHFPYWRRHHDAGLAAAELITSFLLTLVGIFASIAFYFFFPQLLLVPVLFTLLALMYLSKSIYALFEQAEDLESIAESTGVSSAEVLSLSRELALRSKKLSELAEEREKAMREIQAAMKAGKTAKARTEMRAFKKREQAILSSLAGLEKKLGKREFHELSREEIATKKALEKYFLRQAPRILAEKHKAKRKSEGKGRG